MASTTVTGFLFLALFIYFFDTPKEKILKNEIKTNQEQLTVFNKELDKLSAELDYLRQRDANTYRVIYEADPIPDAIWESGTGGTRNKTFNKDYSTAELMEKVDTKIESLKRKMVWQSKSYDELANLILNKEEMLASIPAIQPVSNKNLKQMASGYGFRVHPVYKVVKFHSGMDFSAPIGTEIYATGKGIVEKVEYNSGGYGNMVIINHGYGYKTLYAHMNKFAVRAGQEVARGQTIGFVGNTGTSVGPHLHYEVIKGGEKINPSYFYFQDLNDQEFQEMLRMSENSGASLD